MLLLLITALPGFAQVALEEFETPPPGYPPKMGEISGTLGDKPVAWETFDFSIGAFDASAWADADWTTKAVTAHLMGYAPGKPDEMAFRILIKGGFGAALRTGAADAPVTVAILGGKDIDGPRLTSDGQQAELVIDSIGPKVADSYSRRVMGHVTARLCPKGWLFRKCQDLSVRFDTEMQVSNALNITP